MTYEILKAAASPFIVCDLAAGETVRARSGAMAAAQSGIELDGSASEAAYDGYKNLVSDEVLLYQILVASQPARAYLTHSRVGEAMGLELDASDSWIVRRDCFVAASSDVRLDTRLETLAPAGRNEGALSVLQAGGPGILILGAAGSFLDLEIAKGERYDIDAGQLAAWKAPEPRWREKERARFRAASPAAVRAGEHYLASFEGPARVLLQSGRPEA